MKSLHFTVSGRVQGVWFRAWTVEQATALGLGGWVRNCRDGTVEAVVSGPDDAVEEMTGLIGQGPPLAKVSGLTVTPCDPPQKPGFHALPSV